MASLTPGLRRLVLSISSRSDTCVRLSRTSCKHLSPPSQTQVSSKIVRRIPRRWYTAPPNSTSTTIKATPEAFNTSKAAESPIPTDLPSQPTTRRFPTTSSKGVAYWLLGSAASVFGIVVFGGLTRLTESGLSITEWRPVTGSLPPMSQGDWESEFDKYRASPEFKLLNPHMTIDEFKKIYYMEWTHRVWGRFVGLSFVLPTLYFIARRKVSPKMAVNLLGISSLIGFQGFIGWWMVKSGLKDDLFAPGSHPRVSQYRLTAHLATAFVCYSWMLVSGLSILRAHRFLSDPASALSGIRAVKAPALAIFRRSVFALTGLVFLTALSGALVAGLDAGLIYNEFPMMGTGLAPPSSELWDKFYSRKDDHSDLWWRNMLENPSTVQLDHRIMATTTFTSVLALWAYSRSGRIGAALPTSAKKGALGLVHLVLLQATLGITTLIYMIPVPLAAAHQAGALALLSGALVLAHRVHVPAGTVRMLQRRVKEMSK